MKKILNLFLVGTIAFGFTACDKNKSGNEPQVQGDVTSMRLSVSEASLKAVTDGQGDADGQGAESMVKDGIFLTLSEKETLSAGTPPIVFTPTTTGAEKGWVSDAIEYKGTTGKQIATLVLNAPSTIGEITQPDYTLEIDQLGALTASTGFTMSGTTNQAENTITIQAGVSLADAKAGNKNSFEFTVERLVSKVQFSLPAATVTKDTDIKGEFSDLRYAVAGGADKIYLFGDNAGKRSLDAGTQKYTGFKSAIHDIPRTTFTVNADGSRTLDTKRANLTKVSDTKLVAPFGTPADWATKNSLPLTNMADYTTTSQNTGIFFFENSLGGDPITAKGQLMFNDITYVKVYATFAPTTVKKWDNVGEKFDDVPVTATNNEYSVAVTDAVRQSMIDAGKAAIADFEGTAGSYTFKMIDKKGTFYKGANGELYFDLTSAIQDNNPTAEKYDEGKMLWMTPANNQTEGTGDDEYTKYADTRRNNIYSLSLTRIDDLGSNFDPIDPQDPNLKEPKNPYEPKKSDVVPIDEMKTHIQVKATILKWNLVHKGVILK